MKRLLTALVAAATLSALLVPAAAPATSRRCSGVAAGKYPVVVIRGVTCATAKHIATQFIRSQVSQPWHCGLAHAPFRQIAGVKIAASCGYGPRAGGIGLTGLRHAFAIGNG